MLQCHPPALKVTSIVKQGKATPVQVWKGPEGSRRLRLPDSKTVST